MFLAVFASLQIVSLVVWATPSAPTTRASLAAASLTLLDGIGLCFLSYFEHLRSIRPSSIINVYLLLTIPLDAARIRTLWLRGGSPIVAAILSSTLSVKVLIFITEALEKRDILLAPYSHYSPEATSGIYSRSFFWWLNPLFRTGYSRIIADEDLYPIDDDMSSIAVEKRLQNQWHKRSSYGCFFFKVLLNRQAEKNKHRPYALITAIAKAMVGPLAAAIFPRMCLIFFRYMQPFLINRVTRFVADPVSETSTNVGWGLTAAYGLVYTGNAVSFFTRYSWRKPCSIRENVQSDEGT